MLIGFSDVRGNYFDTIAEIKDRDGNNPDRVKLRELLEDFIELHKFYDEDRFIEFLQDKGFWVKLVKPEVYYLYDSKGDF